MALLRDASLLVLVLGGAVGGSQVPQFIQQYEQRLGGARDEAALQLGRFAELARAEGLDLVAYTARLTGSADGMTARLGQTVAAGVGRAAALQEQAALLAGAGWLAKPLVLLQRHDPALLQGTWASYRYSLTLDPAYAVLGAVLGLLANTALWGVLGWSRRIGRRPATTTRRRAA